MRKNGASIRVPRVVADVLSSASDRQLGVILSSLASQPRRAPAPRSKTTVPTDRKSIADVVARSLRLGLLSADDLKSWAAPFVANCEEAAPAQETVPYRPRLDTADAAVLGTVLRDSPIEALTVLAQHLSPWAETVDHPLPDRTDPTVQTLAQDLRDGRLLWRDLMADRNAPHPALAALSIGVGSPAPESPCRAGDATPAASRSTIPPTAEIAAGSGTETTVPQVTDLSAEATGRKPLPWLRSAIVAASLVAAGYGAGYGLNRPAAWQAGYEAGLDVAYNDINEVLLSADRGPPDDTRTDTRTDTDAGDFDIGVLSARAFNPAPMTDPRETAPPVGPPVDLPGGLALPPASRALASPAPTHASTIQAAQQEPSPSVGIIDLLLANAD